MALLLVGLILARAFQCCVHALVKLCGLIGFPVFMSNILLQLRMMPTVFVPGPVKGILTLLLALSPSAH